MSQTPHCPRALAPFVLMLIVLALIVVALVAVSPLASAGPVPVPDPVLSWRLDDGSVPPEACPYGGVPLPCGAWGDYRLAAGPSSIERCGTAPTGTESPPAFVPSGWPPPPPGAWFPCRDGECFETEPGPEPWAAVVDWDDPHGWSVGETLLQAGDGRVEARLFPLDQPPSSVEELLGEFPVGDAHLLAQLCVLAGELEAGLEDPPLVVNISAGRFAGEAPATTEPTLASQVHGLIDYLAAFYDIAFVAAAGHHRAELFPAHLPPVLAVAPLDLSRHRYDGHLLPSWQAPGGSMALFPSQGLKLYPPAPSDDCWPVPAGSSFASATAAGWIAAYRSLEDDWDAGDAGAAWAPVGVDDRYHLSRNWSVLEGSGFEGSSALVAGALDGSACGEPPAAADAVLDVLTSTSDPTSTLPSLVELIDEIGPSPENEPCVPCDIPSPFGPGEILRLGASLPLVPYYEVEDLFLLIGTTFHRLRSPAKSQILLEIQDGTLGTLELRGLRAAHVQTWDEVLLVFQLGAGGEGLWTSVPIDVLPPP